MATREFTVTELTRTGDGGLVDAAVKFTWDIEGMSAPRGSWRFGMQQRTVREDYPGTEEPVEQVLGPNFKEFTLNGVWDDRYNYPGFALDTWRGFEQLVARGSLCRFEFETVSVVGLLKDVDFDYKRAAYIGYSFTVSPHYRVTSGIQELSRALTAGGVRRRAPDSFRPITEYRDETVAMSDKLMAVDAEAPKTQFRGTLAQATSTRLRGIADSAGSLVDAVSQRVNPLIETFEAIKRVSAILSVIKGQAADLLVSLNAVRSDTSMAWDSAVDSLRFDVWRTQLTATARRLALLSGQGAAETAARVEPKAVALYRPHRGESLYSISQKFYGTPHGWHGIAERNGISTMTLRGSEVLIIPTRR